MGVIRPKSRRLAHSAAGSGQTKSLSCKSHFEIFESIPRSNLNAFAVSQMSCLSRHLLLLEVTAAASGPRRRRADQQRLEGCRADQLGDLAGRLRPLGPKPRIRAWKARPRPRAGMVRRLPGIDCTPPRSRRSAPSGSASAGRGARGQRGSSSPSRPAPPGRPTPSRRARQRGRVPRGAQDALAGRVGQRQSTVAPCACTTAS